MESRAVPAGRAGSSPRAGTRGHPSGRVLAGAVLPRPASRREAGAEPADRPSGRILRPPPGGTFDTAAPFPPVSAQCGTPPKLFGKQAKVPSSDKTREGGNRRRQLQQSQCDAAETFPVGKAARVLGGSRGLCDRISSI
jgi:hypothetical protein